MSATLVSPRVVTCPAPCVKMIAILIAAQQEELSYLDITRGCGKPTPEAERGIFAGIEALAKATALATRFKGGQFEIPPEAQAAVVESMDPLTLFQGLVSACKTLQAPGALLPEGITEIELEEIRLRTMDAIKQVDTMVDASFGD